jgi:hypothetical protein
MTDEEKSFKHFMKESTTAHTAKSLRIYCMIHDSSMKEL